MKKHLSCHQCLIFELPPPSYKRGILRSKPTDQTPFTSTSGDYPQDVATMVAVPTTSKAQDN